MVEDALDRFVAGVSGLLGDDAQRPGPEESVGDEISQSTKVGDCSGREVTPLTGLPRPGAHRQPDCLSRELGHLTLRQMHRSVGAVRSALLTPADGVADHGQLQGICRSAQPLGRLENLCQRALIGATTPLAHPSTRHRKPPKGLLHHGQLIFEHVSNSASEHRQRICVVNCHWRTVVTRIEEPPPLPLVKR